MTDGAPDPALRLEALLCARSYHTPGGVAGPATLAREAAGRGFTALGLTDVASVAGVVALEQARGRPERVVYGTSLTVEFAGGPAELALLAASRTGYAGLCALITLAHTRPAPEVTLPELLDHSADLFILTGGRAGLPIPLLAARRHAELLASLEALRQHAPGRVFVQLGHGGHPGDARRARGLWLLAREARLPAVAAPDVLLPDPTLYPLHDALTCARLGLDVRTPHPARPRNAAARLDTPEAWGERLPFADALANATRLARECAVTLTGAGLQVPPAHLPPNETPQTFLETRCAEGLAWRYPDPARRVGAQVRLAEELAVIADLGLAEFFLVAAEITDFCRLHGILAAGRGSAAASVVCYLLGVTLGDPIRHDLLFERFLHTGQILMPDIDIDIASHRRREVIAWVEARWGAGGAGEAMVANRVTYRLPSAVQDLGRALGLPPETRDRLTRALGRDFRGHAPGRAGEAAVVFDEVLGKAPVKAVLLELLGRMEHGFVRHLAPHSGGVVLSARPLTHHSPLTTSSGGLRLLSFDKDDTEALGLIKLDLLGLRMLSALERAREEVVRLGGPYLDYGELPDDPAVWRAIADGDTLGIFQVESPGQVRLSTQLRPRDLLTLAHQIALFRPGPIQSGTVHPYVRRARGLEPVPPLPPVLARVLGPTRGVILFQEQILRLAHHYAGWDWLIAERFRRALGRAEDEATRAPLRAAFVRAAGRLGAPAGEAGTVFEWCAAFRGFGFAESHAQAFALHTYASAWMRAHHPAAYLAGLLGEAPGMWPPATLAQEARRWGLTLLPVDVNSSFTRYRAAGARAVRLPLTAVDGVADEDAQTLVLERLARGPYLGLDDLWRRARVPPAGLDALARAGALDPLLPESASPRREALQRLTVLAHAGPPGAQALLLPPDDPPPLPPLPEAEALLWDHDTKRLSESGGHPMNLAREAAHDLGCTPLSALRHGQTARSAGLIVSRQKPPTARGYAFFVIEDGPERAQVVISPELWAAHRLLLRDARALVVEGRVERAGRHLALRACALAELPLPIRARGYEYG